MNKARTFLRLFGGIGFILWPLLYGLAWVFARSDRIAFSSFQAWLTFLAPFAAFIYYLYVTEMKWSRLIFVVGLIIHAGVFFALLTLMAFTDGGFLVAPLLLVGPITWLTYAARARAAQHAS
jgi:hypothetical protein